MKKMTFIALLFIIVMQLLFIPLPRVYAYSNPATVPLLTVSNFAALAASTITSPTGPTVLNNGDLGTNGVCTDFPGPDCTASGNGTINNGSIQYQNTAATDGQTDATAAVGNIGGRTADTTLLAQLGGQTLTQGVYDVPADTTNLTGDLTLNGDANSVFIFRMASTLITDGGSRVVLGVGVQACNVFWKVASSATFNGNTTMVGTVLAQASITFSGPGGTLAGRAIAQTAAITFNNTTVNNSSCASPTPTPTPTPTPATTSSNNGGGDGRSDGRATNTSSSSPPSIGNPLIPGFPDTGIGPDPIRSEVNNNNIQLGIFVILLLGVVIFYLAQKSHNARKTMMSMLLLVLIFGVSTKIVHAQDSPSVLYVPLIGITLIPQPLAFPSGPGDVMYHYAVKNFLSEVALTDIQVTDDKCSSVKFITGDDDGDSQLDYNETWRYSCATRLSETTQSTATATATAYNIVATDKAYATVVVGSDNPAPLVSVVNVTKVAYPLSLPSEGGTITFTYRVNNPGVVPLNDVKISDNKCSNMSGKLGDTNANNLLDLNEVWVYTCVTNLTKTTTNTVTVTAFANGLQATDNFTILVKVANSIADASPNFPDAGVNPNIKSITWKILSGILVVLTLLLFLKRESKFRKIQSKRKSRRR